MIGAAEGREGFLRIDVSAWPVVGDEQVGAMTKWWLEEPNTERRYLWKQVSVEATGLQRTLGHDWSERVATEIARHIGVPAANVDLAMRDGARGVVSESFSPPESGLQLANASTLLPGVVPGYPAEKKYEVEEYTVDAAFAVLKGCEAHPDSPGDVDDAASTFAGYLMLDAVIGNTDRHHDNWGVLQRPDGTRFIAPAFDQATGLGYQAREEKKAELLKAGTVERFAERGCSRHFRGKPTLVALAVGALSAVPPAAAAAWLERLDGVDDGEWTPMLDRVPADLMSQVDRMFASELLRTNKRRLLDAWHTH